MGTKQSIETRARYAIPDPEQIYQAFEGENATRRNSIHAWNGCWIT